jgi:hypothetical protein
MGALAMVIGATLLAAGCSLPRRYYTTETESIRDLAVLDRHVKRIGISQFENRSTAPRKALVRNFQAALSAALARNCGKVELVESHAPHAPAFLINPPLLENGRADTYAIAQAARRSGFQVIVRGQLVSLRHREERSGWASFRESHDFLDLRLQVVALDALTGIRIGQDSELISLPVDANTGAAVDAGAGVDLSELTEAVKRAGVAMALKLCTPIRSHPWQTVVMEIQGTEMILAAHPAAELKVGDRLAVFDGSRIMTGSGDERFVMAGFRRGTVAVTRVADDAAAAKSEAGETFPVGSILVPVR